MEFENFEDSIFSYLKSFPNTPFKLDTLQTQIAEKYSQHCSKEFFRESVLKTEDTFKNIKLFKIFDDEYLVFEMQDENNYSILSEFYKYLDEIKNKYSILENKNKILESEIVKQNNININLTTEKEYYKSTLQEMTNDKQQLLFMCDELRKSSNEQKKKIYEFELYKFNNNNTTISNLSKEIEYYKYANEDLIKDKNNLLYMNKTLESQNLQLKNKLALLELNNQDKLKSKGNEYYKNIFSIMLLILIFSIIIYK